MQKLSLITSLLLLFCLIVFPQPSVTESEVRFGYNGADGPQNWFRLSPEFKQCETGRHQSPIQISPQEFKRVTRYPPRPYWEDAKNLEIHNNGNTVEVSAKKEWGEGKLPVKIEVAGSTWQLEQFHFHTPSEHRVGEASKSVEMHMVFLNDHEEIAVVSTFFDLCEKSSDFLGPIIEKIPKYYNETNEIEQISFTSLLSEVKDLKEVYHYHGSLTTPPCSEGVRWYINNPILAISLSDFRALHGVIGDNNRFIQERFYGHGNGRNKGDKKSGYKGNKKLGYKGEKEYGYKGEKEYSYKGEKESDYKGEKESGYKGEKKGKGEKESGYKGEKKGKGEKESDYKGEKESGYKGEKKGKGEKAHNKYVYKGEDDYNKWGNEYNNYY